MPITRVTDNENNRSKRHTQKKKEKNKREFKLYWKSENLMFFSSFRIGFLKLICKSSLISKPNVELALSNV